MRWLEQFQVKKTHAMQIGYSISINVDGIPGYFMSMEWNNFIDRIAE